MRAASVAPTGVERTFRPDQIIVSKTDPQGRLTYVNTVFTEISGFAEDDLIGQPHNIIRHPEMPRCVFKLLWDRIESGKEIFAYVVNLCANGDHYWVLAHVTPTFDSAGHIVGYHSNRRVPAARAVGRIRELYAALLAEEARHDRTPDAVAAGTALLDRLLAEQGMDYDRFVWALTNEEVAA